MHTISALALLALAKLAQCEIYSSYSALGDSYSAGFGSVQRLGLCTDTSNIGSPSCTSATCQKDIGSYAYRFAATNASEFNYLTCSGANTTTILQGQVESPQFGTPDLVTLTAGGNDYSTFSNLMIDCVITSTEPQCQNTLDTAVANLPLIYDNVVTVLEAINAKVPDATKVLLGYIQFFGPAYPDTCIVTGATDVSVSVRQQINSIVVQANEKLSELAEQYGYVFVTGDPGFEGHRWCDTDTEWLISDLLEARTDTQGVLYTEVPFAHPTVEGQTVYLNAVEAALGA